MANIFWISYSMFEGIREAFFDYHSGLNKRRCSFNIKRIFLIQRSLFLFLISILMMYEIGIISILITIGQICMFKYFHKISYDLSSKKLNSEISEKKDEFNIFRKMNKNKNKLLILGISIQIFIYIFII